MLIDDAVAVLKKAWSIKLAVLSAVFSAMEVALPFFTEIVPSGKLAALALLSALGSAAMRVIYQPALHTPPKDEA